MMSLRRHKQDWEEMATVDPLWAIASDPARKHGGWQVDEFFATGEAETAGVLEAAQALGYPRQWESALDFGCGVGRITRAMASRFQKAVGVDISEEMIKRAREVNSDHTNCSFVLNVAPDLHLFASGTFDFIYCSLVLQHLPDQRLARRYIVELLRLLRPGGVLVFQMPYLIPWRNKLQLRRRLYALLRRVGFRAHFLYKLGGLNPIRMISMTEKEIRGLAHKHGGVVVLAAPQHEPGQPIHSMVYFISLNDTASKRRDSATRRS
jgi:SAM-dependent methyltransferase